MKSQPTGAFYVLSALGPVGTQVEILAGPLGSLSAARGARERVHVYHFGPGPRVP